MSPYGSNRTLIYIRNVRFESSLWTVWIDVDIDLVFFIGEDLVVNAPEYYKIDTPLGCGLIHPAISNSIDIMQIKQQSQSPVHHHHHKIITKIQIKIILN
eukprot:273154_1